VGEIGIPRREFLYDIRFWEVRRIIRGYRRRDLLKHQLMAECVYAATYAMRNPEGKTVEDMFPSLFKEEEPAESVMTDKEREDLQADIDSFVF
jgi:hypothetical protein